MKNRLVPFRTDDRRQTDATL